MLTFLSLTMRDRGMYSSSLLLPGSGAGWYYKTVRGETVTKIAEKIGISAEDLLGVNAQVRTRTGGTDGMTVHLQGVCVMGLTMCTWRCIFRGCRGLGCTLDCSQTPSCLCRQAAMRYS